MLKLAVAFAGSFLDQSIDPFTPYLLDSLGTIVE
jgi:hypothetical protein